MRMDECIFCANFPCTDVDHKTFTVPGVQVEPSKISVVMITETSPRNPEDYFYARPDGLFARTTQLVFGLADSPIPSIDALLQKGIYLTTAVKCAKIGNAVSTDTVVQCSHLLEQELGYFPNARVYLLMGDVAIKAVNAIAKRQKEARPVPSGATYKIRHGQYFFHGIRVFPSYLQAGLNIFLETGKQAVIAEDIRLALETAGIS